tara:strand:+ start:352 stop:1335 length:984 start_codon:yes stop_codon:yes gene_type:complete
VEEKSRILKKATEDQSRPVSFEESFGGSENQFRTLLKYLPDKCFKDINLILNNASYNLIEKNRINVLWMHHYINQKEAQNLGSSDFIKQVDYIVFNSDWNFKSFATKFNVPANKSIVIKNAIDKIDFKPKPKGKINLIYHTTPWRGLELLLKIFKKLDIENVELNVFSSTKIYGKKFDNILGQKFEKIFDECRNTKNVNYFGFMNNQKILNFLDKMHIFSYPSIWPETSCIAAIESMAAGCEVVTTNLGALSETCSSFGTFVDFSRDINDLEKKYSETLKNSIKNFWSETMQKHLKLQSEKINREYSWDKRKIEWQNFFDKVRELKS